MSSRRSSSYDEKALEEALVRPFVDPFNSTKAERARELKMKALKRLKRLRRLVRSKSEPGEYIDEIITINEKYGGGELYYVNTPKTRAWFLIRDESWIYIERENDGSFSLLYSYGGGELYYVNTPKTRAWFLIRDESWIYIERENDGSFSLLYSVKKLYKSKYLIRALAE
uniref:DUF4178 domain-containing protein n=1 Tax=Ascaris lumbricoides TaxID=6252 RepID=A0A0M3I2V6_ASCLU